MSIYFLCLGPLRLAVMFNLYADIDLLNREAMIPSNNNNNFIKSNEIHYKYTLLTIS